MDKIVRIFADAKSDIENTVNSLPNSKSEGVGSGTLNNVLFWVIGIAGIAAVGVLVYGSIKYLTAQGDPGKVKQASQIIAYALIGLLVVALAGAITAFATGAIGGTIQ